MVEALDPPLRYDFITEETKRDKRKDMETETETERDDVRMALTLGREEGWAALSVSSSSKSTFGSSRHVEIFVIYTRDLCLIYYSHMIMIRHRWSRIVSYSKP